MTFSESLFIKALQELILKLENVEGKYVFKCFFFKSHKEMINKIN